MLRPEDFFDLSRSKHSEIFDGVTYVWEALSRIPEYVQSHLEPAVHGEVSDLAYVADDVYIGPGTVVEPGAMIKGPSIIGAHCDIRCGAYIRGNSIVGDGAVVGNSTELKVCLLFDEATVPHFAYVGDSILGWRSHLGAGVKVSNLKITRTPVVLTIDGVRYETGLRKFGAILGDEAEVGCNSVLNPGTLLGPRSLAYTNGSLYGYYPPDSLIKVRQTQEIVSRRYDL